MKVKRALTMVVASAVGLLVASAAFGGSAIVQQYGGSAPIQQQVGGNGGTHAAGTLPFTGLNLALMVIAAVALVAVGWTLRRTAKRA